MVALPLALTFSAMLAAAPRVHLDVALNGSTQARSAGPGDEVGRWQADANLGGHLGLGLERGAVRAGVAYAPSARFTRDASSTSPLLRHGALLSADWTPDSSWTVRALQQLTWGQEDLSLLGQLVVPAAPATSGTPGLPAVPTAPEPGAAAPDSAAPPEAAPAVRSVRSVHSTSTLGIERALGRRLRASTSFSYIVSGGSGRAARAVLPRQSGPELSVGLAYLASRLDSLATTLRLAHSDFAGTQTLSTVQLTEAWQRQLSPRTTSQLGLGISLQQEDPVDAAPRGSLVPLASGSLTHRWALGGRPADSTLSTAVEPSVDRFTGALSTRLSLAAGVGWQIHPAWQLSARGSHGASIGGESASASVVGAGATYSVSRGVGLSAGLSWARQGQVETAAAGSTNGSQVGGFLTAVFGRRGAL
jgi:hypothetical protein